MASHIVELTQTQSIVLGVITKQKCISVNECAYWTELSVAEIERAIPVLEKHRLIFQTGGYPKRYKVRLVAKKDEDDDDVKNDGWVHPDIQYEAEAESMAATEEEVGVPL